MLHPLLRATSCVNLALDRGVGNEFKLGQEPPYDYAAVSSANPIGLWIVIHAPAWLALPLPPLARPRLALVPRKTVQWR